MKIFTLAILILIISVSCDKPTVEDCSEYDYGNCNTVEPETGTFIVKLTINDENPLVPLTIYKGKYENKDTVFFDTLNDELLRIDLPLNSYYSVSAHYKKEDQDIIAIDGDDHILKSYDVCDSVCYVIKGGKAVVKLAY